MTTVEKEMQQTSKDGSKPQLEAIKPYSTVISVSQLQVGNKSSVQFIQLRMQLAEPQGSNLARSHITARMAGFNWFVVS